MDVKALFKTKRHQNPDPVAVLLSDGTQWRLTVFGFQAGESQLRVSASFDDAGVKALPEEVLATLLEHQCRRLRVFEFSDVHLIDLHLPTDARPSEIQTALSFDIAPTLKMEVGEVRVAAVRASTYRMGGDPDQFLAAGFDGRTIDRYESACEERELDFEGVGSLEMALLACHARRAPGHVMLLMRDQSMFAVVPGGDGTEFYIRHLPQGRRQAREDTVAWSDNLQRRLPQARGRDVVLIQSGLHDETAGDLIQNALNCRVAEMSTLDEMAEATARHAAWGHVGVVDSGCATISQPPPELDWPRLRRLAFMGVLVVSVLTAQIWALSLSSSRSALGGEVASRKGMVQNRAGLQAALKSERLLEKALGSGRRVDDITMLVLDHLPRLIGPWSRITGVSSEGGELVVTGETVRTDELPAFYRALDRQVAGLGWRVEERGLEYGRQPGQVSFTYHIVRESSR